MLPVANPNGSKPTGTVWIHFAFHLYTPGDAFEEAGLVLEVVVHHEDQKAIIGRTLWFEDLAELAEAAPDLAGLGDGLEVAEEVHDDQNI